MPFASRLPGAAALALSAAALAACGSGSSHAATKSAPDHRATPPARQTPTTRSLAARVVGRLPRPVQLPAAAPIGPAGALVIGGLRSRRTSGPGLVEGTPARAPALAPPPAPPAPPAGA